MRRSICLSEPSFTLAGEENTWKFSYTSATNLPKGTALKFSLNSKGRDFDWETPEAGAKENGIWLETQEGKQVEATPFLEKGALIPDFEFQLPVDVKGGETFSIVMGCRGKKGRGNRSQTLVQRRRPFHLFIDPKGKGDYKDPEVFNVDIRGNILSHIQIITPSIVEKNKRFDVTVRFEDAHGNLTANAPEGTLIEFSYEHFRENLSWKLFVPETGFIILPNLYFNEPGTYQIKLHDSSSNKAFFSPPIQCYAEFNKNLHWGLFHGESDKIDAAENAEGVLRSMRDEKGFQFFGFSPFESAEETPNEIWKGIVSQVSDFNEDNRFSTFLGCQWHEEKEGVRQFIYAKESKPIMRKREVKNNSLQRINKSYTSKEILSVPCFTMGSGFETNFKEFNPEIERVVEIYNAWGSSECLEKEGNLRPIKTNKKGGIKESANGSIRAALAKGCRFGFIAGGFDDRGIYSPFYDSPQEQYSAGLTAIFAIEQSRETLYQALLNRCCYATTGERILLNYTLAGALMGSELNTTQKPGLLYNRHFTITAAGTSDIDRLEIIRCGKVIHTIKPTKYAIDTTFDDSDKLDTITLKGSDGKSPFVYYYLRVIQKNGHMAWGSPIWVDLTPGNGAVATKGSKK